MQGTQGEEVHHEGLYKDQATAKAVRIQMQIECIHGVVGLCNDSQVRYLME